MSRLRQIFVDCAQPAALARCWVEALDGFEVRSDDIEGNDFCLTDE